MHATQFYHPIPRLRPQPIEITMTIFNRRRTSQRRYDKLEQAKQFVQLAQAEERLEQDLLPWSGRGRSGTGGEGKGQGRLGDEWRIWIKDAREREKREVARSKVGRQSLPHTDIGLMYWASQPWDRAAPNLARVAGTSAKGEPRSRTPARPRRSSEKDDPDGSLRHSLHNPPPSCL